jgi:hypothetical protein
LKDELPEELLGQVRQMMIEGVPSYGVADHIQKAGFCLDDDIDDLGKLLRKWVAHEIPLAERVLVHKPLTVKRAIARFEGMTEELEQLCDLLTVQRVRLDKALSMESDLAKGGVFVPLRSIDEIVDSSRRLVESMVKIKVVSGLNSEHGPSPLAREVTLLSGIQGVEDPLVRQVMSDPIKKANVLRAIRRIIDGNAASAAELPPVVVAQGGEA